MKNRLLKTFTSLVLTVLMVISVMPAFAITIGAEEGGTYKLVTDASTLAVGDQVIIVAKNSAVAMSTDQKDNNRGQVAVEKSDDESKITNIGADVQVFTLEAGTKTGTFAFYTGSGYIYAASSSKGKNYLRTQTTKDDNGSWTISIANGVATIQSQGSYTNNLLKYNSAYSLFSCYASGQKDVSIYKFAKNTEETTTETACEHTNTTPVDGVPATCTKPGTTAGVFCNDCATYISGHEEISALGHNFVNGECTVCHEKQPTKLTINRDSFSGLGSYKWYQWTATATTNESVSGYAYVTNNTDSIQMNTSKTTRHIYNNIALPGKIVSIKLTTKDAKTFAVWTSPNAVDQSATTGLEGFDSATKKEVTSSGTTWTFNTTDRFFVIALTDGGAAYLSSIEITYEVCNHTNTESVGAAKEATCTEDGITAGSKCSDCGEILEAQATIPATGHKDANKDYTCDVCGAKLCTEHTYEYKTLTEATCTTAGEKQQVCSNCGHRGEKETIPANGHSEEVDVEAKDPTCTEAGWTKQSHCSVCNEKLSTSTEIPATGVHDYVDGKCTMCDKPEPYFFKVGDVVIFTGSKADGTDTQELTGFASGSTYGTATPYTGTPAGTFPLTVVEGYTDNTYAFKFGDSYITCNGEKKVNLSKTLDANSSWTVGLNEDGSYNIISCSNAAYYLQYNSGSPRFTTYNGSQQPIKVVKYSGPIIKTFGLSLNEGVTVKVTFDIPEAWLTANAGAKVVFSNGEKDIKTIDVVAGVNVYSVKLTPAQINDDLTVKITNAEGNTILVAEKDVSVSAYKAKAEAAGASEQLIALLDAALTYSSVADGTYNGKDLTNDFDGVVDHSHDGELFTGFAGQLGTYASIYINVDTANVKEGDKLVLKIGETGIINDDIAKYITKYGQIVISGLYPANFDDTIYIEASTERSNATFTFNSYLKAIYNSSSEKNVKNLAVATYLYGLAAEAYLTAQ